MKKDKRFKIELNLFEIQEFQSKGIILDLCECGCGEFVRPGKRFIYGHNRRGMKNTVEAKRKVSRGLERYFQENPEKKEELSIKLKRYFQEFGNNFTRGYRHTEKDKKKMSIIKKEYFKIPGNKDYLINRIISEKTRDKISIANVINLSKGKSWKRGYFYSHKNGKKIHYRSSYELTAYEILEQMSKVKNYEIEPFGINYKFFGAIRRTVPDILITYTDGSKELIEVKSEWNLKDKRTNCKIWAMNDYAVSKSWLFNIWTEKQLGLEG